MTDPGSEGESFTRELRSGKRRWVDWFLLDGERYAITAIVLASLFAVTALLERGGAIPLAEPMPLFYLFSAFIGGNFTLITVVISINQLLLSRELGSPGELREQMENVIEYRADVESASDRDVAPVKPQEFMHVLLMNIREESEKLGGVAAEGEEPDAREAVETVVSGLIDHTEEVEEHLRRADTGIFNALAVTLTTNYAEQINDARRIKAEHENLSVETTEALDRIIDRLQEIDVARQYFKSVYLEDELSKLSRMLLYVGVPSQFVVTVALLALTASDSATVIATPWPIVSSVVTVGFLPLAVLFSYVLRTASVTQRTVATIPFTTPRQEV